MGIFIKNHDIINEISPKHFVTIKDGKEKNAESLLKDLLFENPDLIPITDFANSTKCIPLIKELSISNHGNLDILATDNVGHIYIIECKLVYNSHDMKIIRGQISDYVSGIWAKYTTDGIFDEAKFEDFWKWLCSEIETKSHKKLENILIENKVDSVEDTINEMKENFKENNIINVFAVDGITEGLRETVKWHNSVLNTENNYPCFILEIKKYENANNEIISIQTYPQDLKELKITKRTSDKYSPRVKNDYNSWISTLKKNSLKEESRIIDFVNKLGEMLEKDGGSWDWGSGTVNPRAMPVFSNFLRRKPIGIRADGVCVFQFHLIQGVVEYEKTGKEWENLIRSIPDLNQMVDQRVKDLTISKPETWVAHADKILKCLEIFLKRNNSN